MILRSLLIAATPYLEYTSNSRGLSRILEPQPRSGFILDFTLTSGTRPLGLAMCVCVCGMISDVCVCVGVGVGVGLGVGVGVSVGVGVWNDFRGVCMCVWRVCGMTSEVCVCVCGVLLHVRVKCPLAFIGLSMAFHKESNVYFSAMLHWSTNRTSFQHSTCTIQNSRCITLFQVWVRISLLVHVRPIEHHCIHTQGMGFVCVCVWTDVELIAHAPKETYTVCVWNDFRGVCKCFWHYISKNSTNSTSIHPHAGGWCVMSLVYIYVHV